ncbi:MAG: cytochrome C [Geobacteraceae bacterium]|nr:cytochrome C [Geobacteraceae bacterium]
MKRQRFSRHLRLFLTLLIITSFPVISTGDEAPNSCRNCHEDAKRMAEWGYSHFTVTRQEAWMQTGMPADCSDCHLGNPAKNNKTEAHQGMGRLFLLQKKGLKAETAERKLPLEASGNQVLRLRSMTEKDGRKLVDSSVSTILYQDRRADTLTQDFALMEKTCGKCHPEEFTEFRTSNMARNAKQSLYKGWNDKKHGPHNCGVWFADNYKAIAANTAVPYSLGMSSLNQRACNTCHVGCLDCHYDPQGNAGKDPMMGMHTFNRTPKPESCYGGGRGALCHSGPEDRRRGAGYFGGAFSHPEGMTQDIHIGKNIGCIDCHDSSRSDKSLGHATIIRQATCGSCHENAVTSNAASLHSKLSCEACHVSNVAGYQATFWGPGNLAGSETPFYKYNGYYGIMKEPILIKDQKGHWIPVKPFPMAVLNQKSADLKPGLHWRYPAHLPKLQRTDDAWGYVGLFNGLPENNKALLWIQMDKMSHKYGKSRSCDSCHGSENGEQRQEVSWDFSDKGALPFNGRHTVLANNKGLFILDMKTDEQIEVSEGYKLSSLAPWYYLKDKWFIKGNFALPKIKDRKRYERLHEDTMRAMKQKVIHR